MCIRRAASLNSKLVSSDPQKNEWGKQYGEIDAEVIDAGAQGWELKFAVREQAAMCKNAKLEEDQSKQGTFVLSTGSG